MSNPIWDFASKHLEFLQERLLLRCTLCRQDLAADEVISLYQIQLGKTVENSLIHKCYAQSSD